MLNSLNINLELSILFVFKKKKQYKQYLQQEQHLKVNIDLEIISDNLLVPTKANQEALQVTMITDESEPVCAYFPY